jgi:hypothetical protein
MSHSGEFSSTMYRRASDVLSASLGSEDIALLDASRENYFGLQGPASRIWELLETPVTLEAIRDALVAEYEVDAATCEQQTREFLDELVSRNLIETSEGG